jgi:Bacterial pre-peptidase C-terminal domain
MRYIQHFSTLLQKISPMNDNSLGKAQSLGLLDASSLIKRNTLKKNDRVDFYSFTMNRSSTVSFKMSGLKANADLALLNATGQVITRSKKNGNKPEKLRSGLNAGTYFIQVKSRDGRNTAYQLKTTATPVPPLPGGGSPLPGGGNGGGTQSDPIDLGTIDTIPAFRSGDTAGKLADSEKFYKFKLAQNSEIKATFSRVSGQVSAFLYADSNGNGVLESSSISEERFILSSGTEGAPSAFLNIPLIQLLPATGTYFLKVFSANETKQYDLTVATTQYPSSLPSDPGATEATAADLGTLSSGGTLGARDYVGRLDRLDTYRFNLSSNANVTFTSQVVNGDTEVNQAFVSLFRDQNGNNLVEENERVFTLFNQIGTNEKPRVVSTSLLAGTYFLGVEDTEGAINTLGHTAYSFSMTAP